MQTIKTYLLVLLLLPAYLQALAQETELQLRYRQMALAYSHDLKAAEKAIEASLEQVKAASKDLYPKLSGETNFQYTGNPLELTLRLPSQQAPLKFTGKDLKYGIGISLVQPLYTGGRLQELVRAARLQHDISRYQEKMLQTAVCCHADVLYWTTVARKEIYDIMRSYQASVDSLTQTIRERVEAGMTDRQDLLMMEVKQNEATLLTAQAEQDLQNSMMALNSLVGMPLNHLTETDSCVTDREAATDMPLRHQRPEISIAQTEVKLADSERRLNASRYKPQLAVGINGTYSSPGYNFRSDLDPNYAVFVQMSVPLYQWGKRRNEQRAAELRVGMATDRVNQLNETVNLEIATARNSLRQSRTHKTLAHNTLEKARENEQLAVERYCEGRASVLEVIEAQTFRQQAQIQYVQAKVAVQTDYALWLKSINGYQ